MLSSCRRALCKAPAQLNRIFAPASAAMSSSTLPPPTSAAVTANYDSPDHGFEEYRIKRTGAGDPTRREFTYFMLGGGRLVYASVARLAVIRFVASMNPAADVLALASAEFDVSAIPEGSTVTYKWRGKPVFVRHRTAAEIAREQAVDLGVLKDVQSDADRVKDPAWLVVLGICTHLGCVPISNAGDYGGWFCPCHGSHYDGSGRIRKGPAPLNLELPPYTLEGSKLVIG